MRILRILLGNFRDNLAFVCRVFLSDSLRKDFQVSTQLPFLTLRKTCVFDQFELFLKGKVAGIIASTLLQFIDVHSTLPCLLVKKITI